MPSDLVHALERFLGFSPSPLRTAAVRDIACATVEAWREGLITTSQALGALQRSYVAMRVLDS
jgi:hypothetical protein